MLGSSSGGEQSTISEETIERENDRIALPQVALIISIGQFGATR